MTDKKRKWHMHGRELVNWIYGKCRKASPMPSLGEPGRAMLRWVLFCRVA